MKYSEFHRLIQKNGWKFLKATGSHYFYEKEGRSSPPVPYLGSKEMPEGLRKKVMRDIGLK
ncbi:MAG: type II toxin-antitoxin system HicA family toxin [Bacteroidales bacterium]|jgi:mRNA interferase HicA|nr:type II toxin-antitoxin system HicA family toxin [Bacteroidales bacterium]